MRVLCCQHDVVWEDKAANFGCVDRLVQSAQPAPGTLIVLPEMFATGFSMNSEALAEEPGTGETFAYLSGLARRFQSPVLGGAVVREGAQLTNEALVFSADGTLAGRYAKMHPFRFAGEHETITAGKAVVSIPLDGGSITPLICYDLRFPEAFRAADPGCAVFAVIANWPAARVEHWLTLLRARAIENQAFVIGVNRTGADPNVAYPGRSLVVDPTGSILADAGEGESVLSVDLDLSLASRWREEFPAQRDRHPFSFATSD